MATVRPLPAPTAARPQESSAPGGKAVALEPVPAAAEPPREGEEDAIALQGPVARLPVELEVAIPVRNFRVRNLLALAPGALIESQWSHGGDMPLAAGAVLLAWSEFEVVDTQMAARVTRLA
ncbi:MAG: FliM/FliN family flagellar motor switch protein [Terracidiphilus sp.]